MSRYISAEDGDALAGQTLHSRRDCPALEADAGHARPVADSTVAAINGESCPECTPLGNDSASGGDDSAATGTPVTVEDAIENGECPWCSDYSGEHVGQHASSAHTEAWAEHRDGE